MDISDFKQWLISNTAYSSRVIGNIISRLNRADRIHPVRPEEIYLFELEHVDKFKNLSVTVRSQLRKAVKLYLEFEKTQE
ncbi:MAG: hypothetical protein J1E03_01015 [Acetatifactor sp.]|nr:hypothetical protein [Acetatifactor sp.]